MKTMTLAEFHEACKAQAASHDLIVFKCPMCRTLQNARDLIAAGAGKTFEEVETYLAFSCVGRWTGAGSPRKEPDGQPCNWTLGGLFPLHRMVVVTQDGEEHPRFELADKAEADAHRAAQAAKEWQPA
ncbi:MAG: VVA0879 family protein [Aquabacterium sp.]|uniref:VVA0879 family protein n=1 Tax=Aquabacterium sp. TaxID=1872578 RepID=UPI003BAFA330